MTTIKHKCCQLVGGSGGIYKGSPCGKTASFEEDGKWFCKTHSPSVREAKWDAKCAALIRTHLCPPSTTQRRICSRLWSLPGIT